jgi:hypothetical protein
MVLSSAKFGFAVLIALFFSAEGSANDALLRSTVDDPRPVEKAIEQIESIYGIPINYEDPIVIHPGELSDETERLQRTKEHPNRIIVRRSRKLTFEYADIGGEPTSNSNALQTGARKQALTNALLSVLKGYADRGGPETFTINGDNEVFTVSPKNFLDIDGTIRDAAPLLDTKITIFPKQRTRAELLQELCKSLSNIAGVSVQEGWIGLSSQRMSEFTQISGADIPARSLLTQLLTEFDSAQPSVIAVENPVEASTPKPLANAGLPRQLSWKLLFAPGGGYFLNVARPRHAAQP